MSEVTGILIPYIADHHAKKVIAIAIVNCIVTSPLIKTTRVAAIGTYWGLLILQSKVKSQLNCGCLEVASYFSITLTFNCECFSVQFRSVP